ncbi:MAG TPA: hypothetical protein VFU15_05825 [Bacteroidia bacterium]|nr:hypothetical protein [Bacteroidia bacterium]
MKGTRIFFFALLALTIFCVKANAQAFLIDEEFNAAPAAPAGWTFTSISSTYTSSANYGRSSPSVKFDGSGEIALSPAWSGSADEVTFFTRGNGSTPTTDNFLIEGWNGSSWTTVGRAYPQTTAKVFVFPLASNVTRLRFTYTKVVANCAFDDVKVRAAGFCSGQLSITGIMADACGSDEGYDEFVSCANGGPAMNLSDLEITFSDVGSNGGCTYCGTTGNPCDNFFVNNAATNTYIASLNTMAGCGTLFMAPPGNVIPAGGNFIVFAGAPPTYTYNFSNLCSTGLTYYAVFANNTSDNNGRFGNNGACTGQACPRDAMLRNNATGCVDTNYYNRGAIPNNNGEMAYFGSAGHSATYINTGCTTFTVLPIELSVFSGEVQGGSVVLSWTTESENNNSFFTVERAGADGNFTAIGTVNGSGTTSQPVEYEFTDVTPLPGQNYYRLRWTDFNGASIVSAIISVTAETDRVYANAWYDGTGIHYRSANWSSEMHISIFDSSGRLVYETVSGNGDNVIPLAVPSHDMFLVVFGDEENRITQKVAW